MVPGTPNVVLMLTPTTKNNIEFFIDQLEPS